jgi:peroxiredoxin Q/BCP
MNLPSFTLPASDGKSYTQQDLSKGFVVLYVYPKDMTPGCTLESKDFRDLYSDFQNLSVQIFGLSKDGVASHEKFVTKECLPFPLLSDEDLVLLQAMGAWKEKSMYGKTFLGIERSTFLIRDGEIIQEWRKVKVKGHAQEVLDCVQKLKNDS